MSKREVYLDHNATTPLHPEVLEAMLPWQRESWGNALCGHRLGKEARAAIDEARRTVARFFGCATDEVLFTSGGSESNNMAIKGWAWAHPDPARRHIVIGAAEHASVSESARFLGREGWSVTEVPCDGTGQVQPEALAAALRPDTALVSIMSAQNVVGTINRVDELAEVVRGRRIAFHVDAAQTVGKVPSSFPFTGADLLSVAGHKTYGPKGVGALIVRRGVQLAPLVHGAGHERGLRSGTENVAGVVGLAAAIRIAQRDMAEAGERMVGLRDALHIRLAEALPGVVLNGHPLDRLPNTLNLSFLGVVGRDLADRVPELLLATGPACHDRSAHLPPAFRALGLGPERASSSLRISLGRGNTWEEIDRAADLLIAAVEALRREAGSALPAAAQAPSQGPICPRCGSGLRLELVGLAPSVVCKRHPACRQETFLAAPVGAGA